MRLADSGAIGWTPMGPPPASRRNLTERPKEMNMTNTTIRALLAAASLATLLAACGGGGGPDAPPAGNPPAPTPPPPAVTITAAPADVTVDEGQPATFTFGISTQLPFSVEWRRDGVIVASRGSNTFTLPVTSLADDGAVFSARVNAGTNNASGPSTFTTVDAGSARLTVNLAAPAAPSGFSLLPGASGTSALLRWTDNSNNESGFDVIRVVNGQDVTVTTVAANQTTFTLNGLTPGATETLRVRAMRVALGRVATSAAASATVVMPGGAAETPAAPTNARLALVSGDASAVDFAWDDNAGNETGFEVLQVVNGNDVQIALANANQTSIRVVGLVAGTTHTFRVRAVRTANGTTTRSALSSASIALPAPQTQVVTLTATQDNVVRISTIDPAVANQVLRNLPVEVGCTYIVDFGVSGSAATCSRSLVLFDVGTLAGRTIRRAELHLSGAGTAVTFSPLRNLRIGAVQQAWNPATVNGTTPFSVSTIGVVTAPLSTLDIDRIFDVTTIVSRWASGAQANNGFGIALTDESIPGNVPTGAYAMANFFGSRENSIVANRPQLVVEFE
jgi:hypothetical protein